MEHSRRTRRGRYARSMDYGYYSPEYYTRHDYRANERRRSTRMGRNSQRRDEYGVGDYYDYGHNDDYLTETELMEWSKDLLADVADKEKAYFSRENIEKKARDMGLTSNDYTFPELYTATLMCYTDYHNTLGTGNMDLYLRLAKDFLLDEDAELQGGEKLCAYYDTIVDGD